MPRFRKALSALLLGALMFAGCSSSRPDADPLSGKWTGHWGPSAERQTAVTVKFEWDGKALTGAVNPGTNEIPFSKAAFQPASGEVALELDGPNSRRETVRYKIQGQLSGTKLSGKFDRGGESGTFEIERQ